MENFIYIITNSILQFKILDIVDILLVTFIIYQLIKLTKKTRAIQVLKGVGVFVIFSAICELIGLTTMSWLLESFISLGAVLLAILFQPELRRAFEKVGRGKLFDMNFAEANTDETQKIDELQRAILNMSKRKIGALIVFEQKTGLRDVMESGIELEAKITSELVENVFFPNSPLHDGAMIIRNGKVAAAGCFLPMSDNKAISSELGTRHRAALGISEVSDCIVLIVSEETGVISSANEGVLRRYMDSKALRKLLESIFVPISTNRRIHKVRRKDKQ